MNYKNKKILWHNYAFLFGWTYYLVVPLIIVGNNLFAMFPGMEILHSYATHNMLVNLSIITSLFLFSFLAGSFLPLRFVKKKITNSRVLFNPSDRDLFLISLPFLLLAILLLYSNRGSFFTGYTTYETSFLGFIASTVTLFLALYLYFECKRKVHYYYKAYCIIILAIFSIILLGLGSRMYVLIPVISILLCLVDQKKVKLVNLFALLILFLFIFILIGVWRQGSTVDIETMLYIAIAEPAYTYITTVSYFAKNPIPLFSFPYNFISSFINFLPTFVFPAKSEFIYGISENFIRPFGATSIIVSLISNFGLIGSLIMLFLLGFLFTIIRYNFTSAFGKTYYYCICSVLCFQFFRDSFTIINKVLLYNFLLLPLILLIIQKTLYHSSSSSSSTANFK